MEYLIGVISTLLIISFCMFLFIREPYDVGLFDTVSYRQSHIHELIKDIIPPILPRVPDRQSSNHEKSTNIKVIILDQEAYWVKDNIFYVADLIGDQIDKNSVRTVDTMNMDKVQLDKMFFIMDKLKEDTDDSGNSGK